MITFVYDLQEVDCFIRVSGFPPLIKQTTITTGHSAVSHIGIQFQLIIPIFK